MYTDFPQTVAKAMEEIFLLEGSIVIVLFDSALLSLVICPDNLSPSSPDFFSWRQSISCQLIFEKGLFLWLT